MGDARLKVQWEAVAAGAVMGSLFTSIMARFAKRRVAPTRIEWVSNPKTGWKPGDGAEFSEKQVPMRRLLPTEVPGGSCYPLVISSYVPRPIALVSTISSQGVVNLAPFSYSGAMGHDPPLIAFSVCRKPGGLRKDTLANIEETKECVIHIMSEWFVEAANHTCGNFPSEEDEFKLSGLTPVPSTLVAPPRCAESGVHFECKVRELHDQANAAGKVTTTIVVAEVVCFHIREDLYDDNNGKGPTQVKPEDLRPMSRLGGDTYSTTTYVYDLPRPDRPKGGRRV
uniref:Flavin reductase like domain-containing protein n=1 Tax=Pyramimonas obovata TaxID=1411642 RepID=A0A7S0MRI4_9CHLO|mmetsp:Transcript_11683/g.24449  ORF Transcript_11683/g.24449 Transcript_11683/m.24449 type:complete len:283 (+) Transcript_11683:234-1082(+)